MRLTIWYTISPSCCAPSVSLACRPAIDPHDRLAFLRERARLVVGHALGKRKPLRDRLIVRQSRVVGRRGDDGHEVRPALGGLADFLHDHAIGLAIEPAPVPRPAGYTWRAGSRRQSRTRARTRARDDRPLPGGHVRNGEKGERENNSEASHVESVDQPAGRCPGPNKGRRDRVECRSRSRGNA